MLWGYEAGEFSSPITRDGPVYGDPDYEGLKALIEKLFPRSRVAPRNRWILGQAKYFFKMGNEFPFQIENLCRFSILNFYFQGRLPTLF